MPVDDVTSPRPLQIWITALVVIFDQVTKMMVRRELDLYDSITVIPGLFSLTRVHNTGAAFGLLNSIEFPGKTLVLTLVAVSALAALAMYASILEPEQRLSRLGLAFIIGGAAGNLIDRIAAGYVLDFVDIYANGWHFWAFNVADAAITVGVTLMILDLLGLGRFRVSRAV